MSFSRAEALKLGGLGLGAATICYGASRLFSEGPPIVQEADRGSENYGLGEGLAAITLSETAQYSVFISRERRNPPYLLEAFGEESQKTTGRVINILEGYALENLLTRNEKGELVEISTNHWDKDKKQLARNLGQNPFIIHHIRFDDLSKKVVFIGSGYLPAINGKGQIDYGNYTSSPSICAVSMSIKDFLESQIMPLPNSERGESQRLPQLLRILSERINSANAFTPTGKPLEVVAIPEPYADLFSQAVSTRRAAQVIEEIWEAGDGEQSKRLTDGELRQTGWYIDAYKASLGTVSPYDGTHGGRRIPIGTKLEIYGLAQNRDGQMYALVKPTQETFAPGVLVDSRVTNDAKNILDSPRLWIRLEDIQLRPDEPRKEGVPGIDALQQTLDHLRTLQAPTPTPIFTSTPLPTSPSTSTFVPTMTWSISPSRTPNTRRGAAVEEEPVVNPSCGSIAFWITIITVLVIGGDRLTSGGAKK